MSETEEIHDCIIAGIDTVAADFEHPAGDASWLIAALLAECGQRYRIDPAQTTLYGSAAAGGYALRALLADGDTWRNAIVCNPRGITRSEERRVGKEWVGTCSCRWWPEHSQQKLHTKTVDVGARIKKKDR